MTENQRTCLLGMLQATTWPEACRWNQRLCDLPEGSPTEYCMDSPGGPESVRVRLPEGCLQELGVTGEPGTRSAAAVPASATTGSAPADPERPWQEEAGMVWLPPRQVGRRREEGRWGHPGRFKG